MTAGEDHHFGVGKSILFSAILVSLCLASAELLVRGWSYYLREDVERFDLASQTFVLVPGRHHAANGTVVTINSEGFVGKELKRDASDLWRIVAVGDSCTYGGGHETITYPGMLQAMLERRQGPGRRYEVVNAGISGLNSELALRRLQTKIPSLHPDVVTIYVGWNDLMKFDPTAQADLDRWSGLARALDRLWLVKGLRKLIFFYIRPHLGTPRTGDESFTGRFAGFRPTIFEQNLRTMIDEVRKMDAQPVLVTLPTVVRPDMTTTDLRRAGVVFPYFSSAYGVGDLLDLVGAYNRTIREIGDQTGVPVIDVARAFDDVDDTTQYFWDTMHTNPRGMELIASALLAGLDRLELLGPEVQPASE